jgi:hypothetical protein
MAHRFAFPSKSCLSALALTEAFGRLEVTADCTKADNLFGGHDPELIEEFKQKWWKWLENE